MGTSRLTVGAVVACATLAALCTLREAGVVIPSLTMSAVAAGALVLALAGAVRTIAAVWRGPELIHFQPADAVECDPAEASGIRAAAQLRGALGGAGHVHRARLVFPAAAWVAAAALGASPLVGFGVETVSASAVLLVAGAATFAFPARPFWYRETRGGSLLVHPRDARALLVRSPLDAEGRGGPS